MEMKTTNEIAQEALTEISHLPRDVLSESAWRDQATAIITKAIEAAQVQGEPVALVIRPWNHSALDVALVGSVKEGDQLYTSPPNRHPLSDQQIINLMPARISAQHDGDLMLFARAIESAINTNTP